MAMDSIKTVLAREVAPNTDFSGGGQKTSNGTTPVQTNSAPQRSKTSENGYGPSVQPQQLASPSKSEPQRPANPAVAVAGYHCHVCKDLGWVYRSDDPKHPLFGKAFRCECREYDDDRRRQQYLLDIDGLRPEDRRRAFEDFEITDGNRQAYRAVTDGITKRRGFITLEGAWGLGKTELLICAVNKARDAGIPAVYTTTAALLDYLRQAYKPGVELDADRRWDLLMGVEVLAIDELEKFNATEWALERFSRLVDERWRRMNNSLTMFATNAKIEALPGDVQSRMEDGRAQIITLGGTDMRKFNEWGQAWERAE